MTHKMLQIPFGMPPQSVNLLQVCFQVFSLVATSYSIFRGLVLVPPRLPLLPFFGAASAEHMEVVHLDLKGLNPSIRGTASSCTGILCKLKRFEIWWFLTVSTKYESQNEFSGSPLHLRIPMAEIGGDWIPLPKSRRPIYLQKSSARQAAHAGQIWTWFWVGSPKSDINKNDWEN